MAEDFKDTDYHMVIGSGMLWGEAYDYAMCILEEMQWIKTKSIHAAEFFHGTIELCEEGTSLILSLIHISRSSTFQMLGSSKTSIFRAKRSSPRWHCRRIRRLAALRTHKMCIRDRQRQARAHGQQAGAPQRAGQPLSLIHIYLLYAGPFDGS